MASKPAKLNTPPNPPNPRRTTNIAALDAKITELLEAIDPGSADTDRRLDNLDQLREILVSATLMAVDTAEQRADRLDLKIANAALQEMRRAYLMLGPHRGTRKVTIFGSARTSADDPLYDLTRQTAAEFATRDWMVVTGAGPGIMAAGLEGAGRGHALGVSIRLPFESQANEFVDDENLVDMRYFFTRKLALMRESDGFIVMPGGFGTLDETFELLTLIQTGKATPVPIVMLGLGHGYWTAWNAFVDKVIEEGYASEGDKRLYSVTNDVSTAVDTVTGFYGNFHSIRWVGDRLIVRMQRGPTPEQLSAVSAMFAEYTTDAKGVRATAPLRQEVDEHDHLALDRISLMLNRRKPGQLRLLIDEVNRW
jgi:uncharacterized protein (TIGR00730 family)